MAETTTHEWGRRLSDAIRMALDSGDLTAARRLALEGDGQARNLAKEYALMYRGLGITIRLLVGLLVELSVRKGGAANGELSTLLRRFRHDMTSLMTRVYVDTESRQLIGTLASESHAGAPTLDDERQLTERLLGVGEMLFSRDQEALARAVVDALDGRDPGPARKVLDDKERLHYVPLHDRLIRFMAESFAFVLREFGPAELLRFHMATAEGQRAGFDKWEQMTPAEFARATVFLLRQHMGQVEVREDAERFTMVQSPCGSGGRLRVSGAYAGPDALPFVEARGPLTFGDDRLPIYCSHCPIWNGVAPLAWYGRPHWVFDPPAQADGSCTLHIYKRRDGAPVEYGRRLGARGAA